jgi:hypothetical protein
MNPKPKAHRQKQPPQNQNTTTNTPNTPSIALAKQPPNKTITTSDARQLDTFKNWEENQLEEFITTIKLYCHISFSIWQQEHQEPPIAEAA